MKFHFSKKNQKRNSPRSEGEGVTLLVTCYYCEEIDQRTNWSTLTLTLSETVLISYKTYPTNLNIESNNQCLVVRAFGTISKIIYWISIGMNNMQTKYLFNGIKNVQKQFISFTKNADFRKYVRKQSLRCSEKWL